MKANLLYYLVIFLSFPLWALEEKVIHIEGQSSRGNSWMSLTSSEELNLKKLIDLLGRSATGEKLIEAARMKAAKSGLLLSDVIKVGETSLTDTTLVRKFSPHSPDQVVYESRSVVYLNRHLSWEDALLDLAHELTHFVYRGAFNPYANSFNAQDFIRSTIEAEGGEVHAFVTECKVLAELFSKRVQSRSHCQKIENTQGHLSYDKAVELFYHVGDFYQGFHAQLKQRKMDSAFKDLKPGKINFVSSAYGVPYPVAALMEFDLVQKKVCENDKKRLAYMQQSPRRSPASQGVNESRFEANINSRCP